MSQRLVTRQLILERDTKTDGVSMRRILVAFLLSAFVLLSASVVDTPAYTPIIDGCTGAMMALAGWQSAFNGCLVQFGDVGACVGEWSMVIQYQNAVDYWCNFSS